jgi:hypothetical protein
MLINDSDVLLISQELVRLRRECAMLKVMLAEVRRQVDVGTPSGDSQPDNSNLPASPGQRMRNLTLVAKARNQKA